MTRGPWCETHGRWSITGMWIDSLAIFGDEDALRDIAAGAQCLALGWGDEARAMFDRAFRGE